MKLKKRLILIFILLVFVVSITATMTSSYFKSNQTGNIGIKISYSGGS